jgi:hypothetical protein
MPDDLGVWRAAWRKALAIWSRFTRLSEPRWCFSVEEAVKEGLTGSFAMIRLTDQAVVIDLATVHAWRLERFAVEVLAHEIGHHVYCPADLTDHGRMLARMRRALPGKEQQAPLVANLYADLLINDRLQRSVSLHIADVYAAIAGGADHLWTLYMRIYEVLWSLTRGTLAKGQIDDALEGDAQLGARLVRVYARDWMEGSGRFGALIWSYLPEQAEGALMRALVAMGDMRGTGKGGAPSGLIDVEAGEADGAMHPALDPNLTGFERGPEMDQPPVETDANVPPTGQAREPFEYGELLRALGMDLSDHEVAVRYYRERALASLIPFPSRVLPHVTDLLPEAVEPWDVGSPLDDVDWFESVLVSPRVVPGHTTVQRVWGTSEGSSPQREPLDLDLYVDTSGSMPNPQITVSYLALAGTIVALSALRAGARVQATLWSGARQFETTGGFIRDEPQILRVITGYIGGSTVFPTHILRDTYLSQQRARPTHILIISDDGVTTMFGPDERGQSGLEVSRGALAAARGGGTMVLNLAAHWERDPKLAQAVADGWSISRVQTWEELTAFAREFSRMTYAP